MRHDPAWQTSRQTTHTRHTIHCIVPPKTALCMIDARAMLYEDQRGAMGRRAEFEETLLTKDHTQPPQELKAPKLKPRPPKSGRGFGATSSSASNKDETPLQRLAVEQAKVMHKEGVLRIDGALAPDTADRLRAYVLVQQALAARATARDPSLSRSFYGVENQRKSRCDLQLSLLQGGYLADANNNVLQQDSDDKSGLSGMTAGEDGVNEVAEALQELLGEDGTLRAIYENLVTLEGEFYELAAVITDPGSDRQQVHPDLPFRQDAPLYVIFLALQDVTADMGPTTFLPGTHTYKEQAKFEDMSTRDDQLRDRKSYLATLKKGDAVLFDARILHCGNANDEEKGSTRALFNFSFRSPKVQGSLGYEGSIRPGYCGKLSLGDVSEALLMYKQGDSNPFAKYGDGRK